MMGNLTCPQCDSSDTRYYDGLLGYQAVRCNSCLEESDLNSPNHNPRPDVPQKSFVRLLIAECFDEPGARQLVYWLRQNALGTPNLESYTVLREHAGNMVALELVFRTCLDAYKYGSTDWYLKLQKETEPYMVGAFVHKLFSKEFNSN